MHVGIVFIIGLRVLEVFEELFRHLGQSISWRSLSMLLSRLSGPVTTGSFNPRALSSCGIDVVARVRISIRDHGLIIGFSFLQELRPGLDPMVTACASVKPVQLHEFRVLVSFAVHGTAVSGVRMTGVVLARHLTLLSRIRPSAACVNYWWHSIALSGLTGVVTV